MIALPRGCTVGFEIKFVVHDITDDMGQWFQLQEGEAWATEEFDHRGRRRMVKHVRFGKAKPSYKLQDGTGNYLIRFSGTDASTASLFLLKYYEDIVSNNMQESIDRYERENAISGQ
jgi:hypothetical protein